MEVGFVELLRASWVSGILPVLIALMPFSTLTPFRGLVLGFAKRGKIMQSSSRALNVPQKWFFHFYAVAMIWTTVLLIITWTYAYKTTSLILEPFSYSGIASHSTGGSHFFSWHKSHPIPMEYIYGVWQSVFLLLLMEAQILRRLYESIYVFNYSSSARMHVFGYLTGLFFYTAAPLSLCCNFAPEMYKFAFNGVVKLVVKGKNGMPEMEFYIWKLVIPLMRLGWFQWIGAAIFFWGWIHQCHCHAILGYLREHKEESDKYMIPYGDWFEMVSSPHYLAEIVIYAGIVVASGLADLTTWLLFGFVVANLVFVAAETQRWYLEKFENYPKNRKAIIPFLY